MRGFGFLIWVLIAVVFLIAPYVLIGVRPEFKYLIMMLIAFGIYNFFRNFFGDSVLTIGLAGITFYYLVWKHFWTFSLLWWVYVLAGMGILSTLGWGWIFTMNMFKRRR
ncbi:MAG: hypothetical protein PWP76_530 [Candidatus Diapherotrites archaeon]|nr:hypothetical protein [Candidatus Diapherotrites archaeon]MDN5367166.1 hypothetical protein [Candidatus Diapherotrites archaeon]